MSLEKKIAVVTGGARGIGRATALKLASEGATVIVGGRKYEKDVIKVSKDHDRIFEGCMDVSDKASVDRFFELVLAKFGTVDILVNNAGITAPLTPFEEVPKANWDRMLDTNTFGLVYCVQAVIPVMKKNRYGKIVNSASIAGEIGGIRTEASYAMSKAANICLTYSLAKYLGPYNVNVNCVSPGVIATDMTASLDAIDLDAFPLRRIGTPEDVANCIAFLCSEDASYLTGVVLDVNGGQHMR